MDQLQRTGLYQCTRQYAMEIHMPGPLARSKYMQRCINLLNSMNRLTEGGFRLYSTVDNVRYVRSKNPKINQIEIKKAQFAGKRNVVLWESHFVNVNVKGTCKEHVN